MPVCALTALKIFEIIALIFAVISMYLSSNILDNDVVWQEILRNFLETSNQVFLIQLENITVKKESDMRHNLATLDFLSRNSNWEYLSCLLQAIVLLICCGHLLCQIHFSSLSITRKFAAFKFISKASAYLATGAGICLLISATYSDDKKYKKMVELILLTMLNENKSVVTDSTTDWLCPPPQVTPVKFSRSIMNDIAIARKLCQYSYSKYIALCLIILCCVIFASMYNYAKSEKHRIERTDMTRLLAERAPGPVPPRPRSRGNGNRTFPSVAPPPPYDSLVAKEIDDDCSNETETAEPKHLNDRPSDDNSGSNRVREISPPTYAYALEHQKRNI